MDRNKYQIQIPLPPKIDPSVTMMTVEEKPDVTYSDIGGCKEQARACVLRQGHRAHGRIVRRLSSTASQGVCTCPAPALRAAGVSGRGTAHRLFGCAAHLTNRSRF